MCLQVADLFEQRSTLALDLVHLVIERRLVDPAPTMESNDSLALHVLLGETLPRRGEPLGQRALARLFSAQPLSHLLEHVAGVAHEGFDVAPHDAL